MLPSQVKASQPNWKKLTQTKDGQQWWNKDSLIVKANSNSNITTRYTLSNKSKCMNTKGDFLSDEVIKGTCSEEFN